MSDTRYHRENLSRLKQELLDIDTEHQKAQSNLKRARQAIVRHDREEKTLQTRVHEAENEIDDLTASLEQESVEEGRIDALKEELQSAEDQKRIAEESFQASVINLDTKKVQLKESRDEMNAKDKEIQGIEAQVNKLDDAARKTANKRQTELREKNAAYERINDRKQDRNKAEREHNRMERVVEDYVSQATEVSARVPVPPGVTADALDQKMEKLAADMKRAEQKYSTPAIVARWLLIVGQAWW
jgi:structural maintenance of chromosomes protein 6